LGLAPGDVFRMARDFECNHLVSTIKLTVELVTFGQKHRL